MLGIMTGSWLQSGTEAKLNIRLLRGGVDREKRGDSCQQQCLAEAVLKVRTTVCVERHRGHTTWIMGPP